MIGDRVAYGIDNVGCWSFGASVHTRLQYDGGARCSAGPSVELVFGPFYFSLFLGRVRDEAPSEEIR